MKLNVLVPVLLAIFALAGTGCGGDKKTPSGYEFKHHVKKDGPHPKVGDYARIQTTVMLDDSLMYSTYDLDYMPPMSIVADSLRNTTTRPLMEALEMMAVGDSLTLFIPLDSIENVPADLRKFKKVVHHIALKEILDQAAFEKEMGAQNTKRQEEAKALQSREEEVGVLTQAELKAYKAGSITDIKNYDVNVDGADNKKATLKIHVIEEGKGEAPKTGAIVRVNYYGVLTDGRMFDNSFRVGQPYEFPLGNKRVIAGWDEGIAKLKAGSKAFFFIPYELAYGEAGSPSEDPSRTGIPPKAELVFYIELEKVYK